MTEIRTLNQILIEELGKRTIEKTAIPSLIVDNISPSFPIRPYQERALRFFLNYWQQDFDGKPRQYHQLLFHMATGSGKTMMMAGLILYLYSTGFRNFLFFVNSTNIIDKTRDNFLNPLSTKYLFAQQLAFADKRVTISEVNNFQAADNDDINIIFSTIQGLHMSLNCPRENGITYEDFEDKRVVLISDEAHHINSETKKGTDLSQEELFEVASWEGTVQRLFRANPFNVLLEFTATVDFTDEALAAKYKSKLLFDYPLKEFRKDGYSKEVKVLQADVPAFERCLQAIILSQYRRKVFEKHRKHVKPVLLFKSKTIKESQDFFAEFSNGIRHLQASSLRSIELNTTEPTVMKAFQFFANYGIALENLVIELREDFATEKLIVVNSKEDGDVKQIAVNSLETNEYRAVFAVDKLNEGWDVLNLFDIVRLYDTRDSKAGKVGRTTMSEAQLIGRGARYCPFRLSDDEPLFERKFDFDLENELRICEELYYHSAYNPKYIQELNTALQEIGMRPKHTRERRLRVKESFKSTTLYKAGHIFLNERIKNAREEIDGLEPSITKQIHKVRLMTGYTKSIIVFDGVLPDAGAERKSKDYKLIAFGIPVLRKALQRIRFYEFDNLRRYLPNLTSIDEFITSDKYLAPVKVEVSGLPSHVGNLSAEDKLQAATRVLEVVAEAIASDRMEYKGSKEFRPRMVRETFKDKTLNFASDDDGDKEFGRSMSDRNQTAYYLDLSKRAWFVFNDSFGTSEEKMLVQYIDKRYDDLALRYAEVYLLRNEKFFKLYSFDGGRAIEPDFLLYLVGKEKIDTVHYQVFIEPKGAHLLRADEWKEDFLRAIKDKFAIEQLFSNLKYVVWGLPFFNSAERIPEFEQALDEMIAQDAAIEEYNEAASDS